MTGRCEALTVVAGVVCVGMIVLWQLTLSTDPRIRPPLAGAPLRAAPGAEDASRS